MNKQFDSIIPSQADKETENEKKEKYMTHIIINDRFELVVSKNGLDGNLYFENEGFVKGPAIRYRDGNPYAPENIHPKTILTLSGITQEEYKKACEEYEKGRGTKTMGPYVISQDNVDQH
ncbi:MAG: hypothetical protein AAB732_00675 [Patescibacteria group bacterium]